MNTLVNVVAWIVLVLNILVVLIRPFVSGKPKGHYSVEPEWNWRDDVGTDYVSGDILTLAATSGMDVERCRKTLYLALDTQSAPRLDCLGISAVRVQNGVGRQLRQRSSRCQEEAFFWSVMEQIESMRA